jgi:hypothetical protein
MTAVQTHIPKRESQTIQKPTNETNHGYLQLLVWMRWANIVYQSLRAVLSVVPTVRTGGIIVQLFCAVTCVVVDSGVLGSDGHLRPERDGSGVGYIVGMSLCCFFCHLYYFFCFFARDRLFSHGVVLRCM